MSTPLQPWEIDILRQFISGRVVDAKGRRVVNGGTGLFTGDFLIEDQIGTIIANALTEDVFDFNTNIVFSATDFDTVAWTSGTLTFADGNSYSISSGNTGNMTLLTYIYFDPDVSTTVLQVTTTFSNAVGENITLLCVAKPAASSNQSAFFVPAVGVFGINETVIGPNSISTGKIQALAITTNELAANSVTSAKINVAQLSAISADIGSVTAGTITGNTIRNTSSSVNRIQLDTTAFTVTDGSSVEWFNIKPSTIGVKVELSNVRMHSNISGTLVIAGRTNAANDVEIYTADGSVISNRSLISLIHGSSGTGKITLNTQNTLRVTVSDAGVVLNGSIDLVVANGRGLTNGSVNASIALPSGAVELYSGSASLAMQDNGTDFFIQSSRTLKFGTHSAIGAETVTGYITVKDAAGNSRKLAVVS